MPLFRPDILEHANPNQALADSKSFRGGIQHFANFTERNSWPLDKRGKLLAIVYGADENDAQRGSWVYEGADFTDAEWVKEDNWKPFGGKNDDGESIIQITDIQNLSKYIISKQKLTPTAVDVDGVVTSHIVTPAITSVENLVSFTIIPSSGNMTEIDLTNNSTNDEFNIFFNIISVGRSSSLIKIKGVTGARYVNNSSNNTSSEFTLFGASNPTNGDANFVVHQLAVTVHKVNDIWYYDIIFNSLIERA